MYTWYCTKCKKRTKQEVEWRPKDFSWDDDPVDWNKAYHKIKCLSCNSVIHNSSANNGDFKYLELQSYYFEFEDYRRKQSKLNDIPYYPPTN